MDGQKAHLGIKKLGGGMMMLAIVVSGEGKLWKEWKQGKICKKKFLQTKKKASRSVFQAKCKIGKDFGMLCSGMIRNVMFETAKSVVKTNPDIIDEHWIRNDDGAPSVIDENMKLDSKSYHEKLSTQCLHGMRVVYLPQI